MSEARGGKPARDGGLPPRERKFVSVLEDHLGEVVPYEALAAALWPARMPEAGPRCMAHHCLAYIKRYRPDLRDRIKAIRSVGLRMEA